MSTTILRCHATVRRAVQLASQRGASGTRNRDEVVIHREERCDTPLVPIPHPERPFWLCPVQHGGCGRMFVLAAIAIPVDGSWYTCPSCGTQVRIVVGGDV